MQIFDQKELRIDFKYEKRKLLRNLKPHLKEGEEVASFFPLLSYPPGAGAWFSTIGRLLFMFGLKHYVIFFVGNRILLLQRKRPYFGELKTSYTKIYSFDPQKITRFQVYKETKNTCVIEFASDEQRFTFREVHHRWASDILFYMQMYRMIED